MIDYAAVLFTWKPDAQPMHRAALVLVATTAQGTTAVEVLTRTADYAADDAAHDARRSAAMELEAAGNQRAARAVWDTEPVAVGATFTPDTLTAQDMAGYAQPAAEAYHNAIGHWS